MVNHCRGIIIPGFLWWCEMDFVHPQYGMFWWAGLLLWVPTASLGSSAQRHCSARSVPSTASAPWMPSTRWEVASSTALRHLRASKGIRRVFQQTGCKLREFGQQNSKTLWFLTMFHHKSRPHQHALSFTIFSHGVSTHSRLVDGRTKGDTHFESSQV